MGIWLLSACASSTTIESTKLPTATPNTDEAPVVQTTSPIATQMLQETPRISPTVTVVKGDSVDALASQTSEGYYQIGDPAAPITMVDYSDFF